MDYKAFISYSHSADGGIAPAIQRGLSTFAKPWYRLRTMRIFRDQTNLAASPGLWTSIEDALGKSEYLLLLCSPGAARSSWVTREVEWWLEHRSARTLLLVLTEGRLQWNTSGSDFDWTRTDAVPNRLARAFAEEPLYVDLTWAAGPDERSMRHSRFRQAILDLAAALLQRPKDELDGVEVKAHRRNRRVAAGAIASLVVLLAVSVAAAVVAVRQQRVAEARLASLCKSLDEAQVLADSSNHGSVYYFQSEFHDIAEECKRVDYKAWEN